MSLQSDAVCLCVDARFFCEVPVRQKTILLEGARQGRIGDTGECSVGRQIDHSGDSLQLGTQTFRQQNSGAQRSLCFWCFVIGNDNFSEHSFYAGLISWPDRSAKLTAARMTARCNCSAVNGSTRTS